MKHLESSAGRVWDGTVLVYCRRNGDPGSTVKNNRTLFYWRLFAWFMRILSLWLIIHFLFPIFDRILLRECADYVGPRRSNFYFWILYTLCFVLRLSSHTFNCRSEELPMMLSICTRTRWKCLDRRFQQRHNTSPNWCVILSRFFCFNFFLLLENSQSNSKI